MISKVYTVFDTAVGAYLTPFYAPTRAMAIRMFSESCDDPSHSFHKYPDQYALFELGDYDNETAGFALYNAPQSLGLAQEFRSKAK